ncbi:MAG: hypothetical protein KGJ58_03650 [Patescibacteria group bacterium]|nr:hypothetical protein [Patescibacteria group bacterium]MDE2218518.1 hypothetical protein [Patescibacteria group bacterium]
MNTSVICQKDSIIIEPSGKIERDLKDILKRSGIINIVIVNLYCMNTRFEKIKELTKDGANLKIFHGGNAEIFNNMLEAFDLAERNDIEYMERLKIPEIVISYWKFYFKNFPATISKNEEI